MENWLFYFCMHLFLVPLPAATTENVLLECDNIQGVKSYYKKGHAVELGSGKDIKLTYYVRKHDFSEFHLYYGKDEIVRLTKVLDFKMPKTNFHLSFPEDKTIGGNDTWYSFFFSIKNISETIHDKKSFKFTLNHDVDEDESGEHTFNVLFGVTVIKDLNESYIVNENHPLEISLSLRGNPKPNVTVLSNFNISVPGNLLPDKPSCYNYNISLKIGRKLCNRKLNISVIGYESKELSASISVNFTARAPNISSHQNISTKDKKADVSWTSIESGLCPVHYFLFYNKTHSINTTKTWYRDVLPYLNYSNSFTIPVFIAAQVNGRMGNASEVYYISYKPSKQEKKKIKTDGSLSPGVIAVIAVVVLLIAGVGIFLVMKRNQVHHFCLRKIGNSSNS